MMASKSDEDDFRSTDGDSEDEFYDCDADKDEENYPKHSLWNKPVGRLSKHGNLKLIKTGEQLFIPITQEPVPKTEDQLEEDTDVLLQLGTDEQGSELRARMMSASLLSDMESFKAANPDSILEDFIRWYSPTDWIEDKELDEWGQKKGHLSTRMLISDNTWVQMWEQAKPVPANRQKRLFDDTREAEKILHYLEAKTLSQILELVLPVVGHIAVYNLMKEINEIVKTLPNAIFSIDDVVKSVRILSRDPRAPTHKYKTVFEEIANQELMICQIKSIMFKFNPTRVSEQPLNEFIMNLVTESEIYIENGKNSYVGSRLINMFSEVQKAVNMTGESSENVQYQNKSASIFPQPSKREFVMRVRTEKADTQSSCVNHMLRAILTKNDFRLCGAFSENIIS